MKVTIKTSILFFMTIACIEVHAQTNVFPDSGNVGIGTTNPSQNLTLNSGSDLFFRIQKPQYQNYFDLGITGHTATIEYSAGTSTNSNLQFLTNDVARMQITHDGNIGIGTTSPSSKLDIEGIGNTYAVITTNSTNNVAGINIRGKRPTTGYSSHNISTEGEGHYTLSINADEVLHLKTNGVTGLTVNNVGKIGIGTTSPDEKLTVKGKIHSEEIIVDLNVPGPDYVFEPDYALTTLTELEAFIQANKHLPEIPSAATMEEEGIVLGEMNMLLLKKIEELTLYTIEQQKMIQNQQKQINDLAKQLNEEN